MAELLPISILIPTKDRRALLEQTLNCLAEQTLLPMEIIICNASSPASPIHVPSLPLRWITANKIGAAPQRNQAFAHSTQPYILFLDDDIQLQPDCIHHLWKAITEHPEAGGITATITNESYTPPGRWTLALLRWLEDGKTRESYAGTCIGPGMTFRPSSSPQEESDVSPLEWTSTACVLYQRSHLPSPPFASRFTGASFGEDLALSLKVGTSARLLLAVGAKCTHLGSTTATNKRRFSDHLMELRNRYWISTSILGRYRILHHIQFAAMMAFLWLGRIRNNRMI